jgi:hypothetical protein
MKKPYIANSLQSIGCLADIFWNEMKIYDKYKNVFFPIKNKSRYLKRELTCKYILSYDTETFNGFCRLIARDNSYIYNPSFYDCLDFMFYKASESGGYRFFYNIDFDISAILKLYGNIEQIDKLQKGISIDIDDYSLYWLKGKFFTLKKGKKIVRFTDLYNFFK